MSNPFEILDQQIIECKSNPENLQSIFINYSGLAASSSPAFFIEYVKKIDDLIGLWIGKVEEAQGLKYLHLGLSKYYQTKFNEVFDPISIAIEEFERINNDNLLGMSFMILGANYRSLGEMDKAVKNLYLGIKKISNKDEGALYKSFCYYQLAEINNSIKDYVAARENYFKSVEISEKIRNGTGLFRSYNGLANLYMEEGDYDKAKQYLDKTLDIKGLSDSQRSRSLCDKGILAYRQKNYNLSKSLLEESFVIRDEMGLEDAASTSLINLGRTLIAIGNFEVAVRKLEKAAQIGEKFNARGKLLDCYRLLAIAYSKEKKWEQSVIVYQKYDFIQREENVLQLKNIYQIKNNKIEEQKQQIQEILTEVKDSINYAKRIQQAILPPDRFVNKHLPNHFICYKPKDIVAGDFYWLETLTSEATKKDVVLFAAADCTGHGVPGAMVSVVCHNALNRAVREYGLTETNEILDKVRGLVIETFEKSEDEVYDGMDISLCVLNTKTNLLQWSGANNPLWIIRKEAAVVEEVKGDKQSIGKTINEKPFTSHQVHLNHGDVIYIFTDGFQDQFGGPRGKKFKASQLKQLLLENQSLSMNEQKLLLSKAFQIWKGELEQVDDVCMIGVRV